MTQLIAHDREVYDVSWLPGSTDIFVSVGADGSLRAFDLRSLEHSTILYETPAPKNVPPSLCFLSLCTPPSLPWMGIRLNDLCSLQKVSLRESRSNHWLLTFLIADDCQVLLWDLANYTQGAASPRSARSRLNSPRPDAKKKIVSELIMAYTAPSQITNLAWSPQIPGVTMNSGYSIVTGEWLAIANLNSIQDSYMPRSAVALTCKFTIGAQFRSLA